MTHASCGKYDFTPLGDLMEDFVAHRDIPGNDIIVAVGGEILCRYQTGYANRALRTPITDDTLYYLFSASKPITCAAVLRLVERGKLGLDDALADYLPAFASLTVDDGTGSPHPAHKPVTIRDLFRMTNGYSYEFLGKIGEMQGGVCETVPTLNRLAELPIRFEPGEKFLYGLGHDLLAAVTEVVTGKKYRDYLAEEVFEPLGMTHTHMHPTEADRAVLAKLYRMTDGVTNEMPDVNTFILGDEYDSGGAGILSCPEDYIKFAVTMTARGLSPNGYRLLQPETVDLMRTAQLSPLAQASFAVNSSHTGYGYALGVRTHTDASIGGWNAPVGEFGWDGAAGSYVSLCPETGITIFYAQHVIGTPHGVNHKDIMNTVYSCLHL